MQANVVANPPGQQRMLISRIVPDQQNRSCAVKLTHRFGLSRFAAQRRRQSGIVSRAMVVDVVRLEHDASKLREQIVLFVSRTIRSDDPDRRRAILVAYVGEYFADQLERVFPRGRSQLVSTTDQWLS